VAVLASGVIVATPITGGAVGPGSIDFTSATATVAEADLSPTTVNLTVQRTDGTDGVATVDYAVTGGSATSGSDFEIASGATGTLTWAEGDGAPQTISFAASPDDEVESDETAVLSLNNATGAALGAITSITVTITNDDDGGSVAFSSAVFTAAEVDGSAPTVTITVNRTGSDGPASVQYSSTSGTATDSDFAGGDGALSWASGESGPRTYTITINDDNAVEPTEHAHLSLSNVTGAVLGTPSTATLDITDDDLAGRVQFDSADYAVVEGEGVLTVSVTRTGGSDGNVTVDHAATDGSATTPGDYTSGDGTLSWLEGDASPRTFTVIIVDDSPIEGDETLGLALSNPTGGLELGAPAHATLTIVDDAGGSDDDHFVIRTSRPEGTTVNGRAGSDSYRIDLGALVGPVSAFDSGTTGFDTVEINAPPGDDDLRLGVLGDGTVQFTRAGDVISMRGIEALVINGGAGTDTLTVDGTGTGVVPGFASFTLGSLRVTANTHETTRFVGTVFGSRVYSVRGYWTVDSNGGVYAFGGAGFFGSTGGVRLNQPVVKLAATPTGNGYWLVASDGGIFSFGDAGFLGSTGAVRLNALMVGMTPTPTGNGYWLVASDGGIFAFGDARFFGSTGGVRLNRPIVGMAATPTGNGYWLVASDGGIFAFGDARFFGSTGALRLNRPIVGMAATPTGSGYWLVASDGGIFAFGDARFLGSTGAIALRSPVLRMAATPSGTGYWLVAADGGVFAFGDAAFSGSAAGIARAVVVDIDAMTLP
jgi:hypothetical protein